MPIMSPNTAGVTTAITQEYIVPQISNAVDSTLTGMSGGITKMVAGFYALLVNELGSVGHVMTDLVTSNGGTAASDALHEIMQTVTGINLDTGAATGTGGIMGAVQGIAFAIALLFFLIAMLEMVSQDRLTIEFFVKFFGKLVISIVLIESASLITGYCIQFGDALAELFDTAFRQESMMGTYTVDQIAIALDAAGNHWIANILQLAGTGFLLQILALAMLIVTYVVCFSRLIEMAVRACFMPIAFALIADDGWRGAGGRYIRKFLAVCAQGAVIVLVGKITTRLMEVCLFKVLLNGSDASALGTAIASGSSGGAFVIMVGVGIACISVMFKSIGIVSDAFGG